MYSLHGVSTDELCHSYDRKFIDKVTLFEATSTKEVDGHLLQLVYSSGNIRNFTKENAMLT